MRSALLVQKLLKPDILHIFLKLGRVATGSYPPVAPTDPDLPDSGIRLLGLWFRCACVDAMHDPWRG